MHENTLQDGKFCASRYNSDTIPKGIYIETKRQHLRRTDIVNKNQKKEKTNSQWVPRGNIFYYSILSTVCLGVAHDGYQ